MIGKKYIVGLMATALLLSLAGTAAAQYSDVVNDPEGDVMKYLADDAWTYAENPNIDILQVSVSESAGTVTVSLKVKGVITDHEDIHYQIFLTDGGDGEFNINYNDGECVVTATILHDTGGFGNIFNPDFTGVGTDTLRITFTPENIGEPDDLVISYVVALNEEAMMVDMAGPDAEYPDADDYEGDDTAPGDDDPDDTAPGDGDDAAPGNGDTEDSETSFLPALMIVALAAFMALAVGGKGRKPRK